MSFCRYPGRCRIKKICGTSGQTDKTSTTTCAMIIISTLIDRITKRISIITGGGLLNAVFVECVDNAVSPQGLLKVYSNMAIKLDTAEMWINIINNNLAREHILILSVIQYCVRHGRHQKINDMAMAINSWFPEHDMSYVDFIAGFCPFKKWGTEYRIIAFKIPSAIKPLAIIMAHYKECCKSNNITDKVRANGKIEEIYAWETDDEGGTWYMYRILGKRYESHRMTR